MKLEVGKEYRTKCGYKVIDVKAFDSHIYKFEAKVFNDDGKYSLHTYTDDGFYYSTKTDDPINIVSEWTEPELTNKSIPKNPKEGDICSHSGDDYIFRNDRWYMVEKSEPVYSPTLNVDRDQLAKMYPQKELKSMMEEDLAKNTDLYEGKHYDKNKQDPKCVKVELLYEDGSKLTITGDNLKHWLTAGKVVQLY